MARSYRQQLILVIQRNAILIATFAVLIAIEMLVGYIISSVTQGTPLFKQMALSYEVRLGGLQPTVAAYLYRNIGVMIINYLGAILFLEIFTFLNLLYSGILFWVFVVETATVYNASPLLLYMGSSLPHGLFEFPAIILEMAVTFRISIALIKPGTMRERIERLKIAYRDAFTALPVILGATIIGAVVEVKITPLLARLILKW